MRDGIYAIVHICYGNSARLSVTRVDQSKMVEVRITQLSPYSNPIPLVFAGKFHPEILTGSLPRAGASNKGGVGQNELFSNFMRQNLENGGRYIQSYY